MPVGCCPRVSRVNYPCREFSVRPGASCAPLAHAGRYCHLRRAEPVPACSHRNLRPVATTRAGSH
eukprot:9702325-Alexandrium_andersonii.AAC.1